MADRRKRGALVGLMSSPRPRQRFRPCTRQDMLKKMRAVAVVMMIVTSTIAQVSGPKVRQSIHEPRRLVWEEHKVDLRRRGLFRRMYRMDEHTFDKLAELLRPILERNEYYASESQVEIRESVAGCVLVNLRALSVYILVVLLVSAALRSVLVTNSLLHWTQLLNMVHSCSVIVTNSIVHWTQLLNMVRSCSAAHECCSTSCLCDQLSFTITIVHCTQLLYMVRSCSSARECCSTSCP